MSEQSTPRALPKARVVHRDKRTGEVSCGEPIDARAAEAWVKDMNKKWGEYIDHWVEPDGTEP